MLETALLSVFQYDLHLLVIRRDIETVVLYDIRVIQFLEHFDLTLKAFDLLDCFLASTGSYFYYFEGIDESVKLVLALVDFTKSAGANEF